ncbi:Basic 7S globulin 2 [Hordeum vulgare]|nr:Basic 7S globulin 2 [Hordeum vulgare]
MPHSQVESTPPPRKMARLHLLVLAVSLAALAWPASCKRVRSVLAPVTKDPATRLYTMPFHYGANLVVDIAGPLVWSTCAPDHLPAAFPCKSATCRLANKYHVPGCTESAADKLCDSSHKVCRAFPYNPVTGACAAGDLIHTRFVANTTDGKNPASQVNVRGDAACAPSKLLESLPQGASGVAGLAGSDLALPAQVASAQKVPNKFLLCLPRGLSSDPGVAVFGGGPLHFMAQPGRDYGKELAYTPLVAKKGNPAHFISIKSIAVDNARVPFPAGALTTGGAVLCTRVPFTMLRSDVFLPVLDAFTKALAKQGGPVAKAVKPYAPFQQCYDTRTLAITRNGYLVPDVTLTLGGGKKWTWDGLSSMVDMAPGTACLAFVQMEGVKGGDNSAPAVLIGGFQMENTVVEFDMKKKRFGFARLPSFTQCSHFNFTRAG